ncbi:putative c-x8-c-x5-c-x3-h type zinc finger protein [Diplodia seriata]|uniref:Putative c-x8-c-x5-c-x3-h type zinc finger protein n=1 Tax=Diplodia seriata TaxID=420778 RepID=A0A0G2DW50_9PEZI|nr:putative c-x8-c-x5-c-x3-h type zinc finger protein [Diplodia seriata]
MLRNPPNTNMNTPPASPPASPPAAAMTTPYKAYLRPTWFIRRDGGAYVPVVPVDELPHGVELEEAPRRLKEDGAQGMKYLGKLPSSGQMYSLVQPATPTTTRPTGTTAAAAAARSQQQPPRYPLSHRTYSQTTLRPLILGNDNNNKPQKTAADAADDNDDAHPGPLLPPSGREPDPAKKEYCTYWIRTGECDFTQQGCLFKHEMPDLRTLREKVGVGAVPHWYQMKCAVERRRREGGGGGGGDVGVGVGETPAWLKETVGR